MPGLSIALALTPTLSRRERGSDLFPAPNRGSGGAFVPGLSIALALTPALSRRERGSELFCGGPSCEREPRGVRAIRLIDSLSLWERARVRVPRANGRKIISAVFCHSPSPPHECGDAPRLIHSPSGRGPA